MGGQSLLFVLGGHCPQVVFVIRPSVGGCCSQVGDGSMVVVVHGGSSLSMGGFHHHGGSHRHGGFHLPWAVVIHGWLSSVGGHCSWVGDGHCQLWMVVVVWWWCCCGVLQSRAFIVWKVTVDVACLDVPHQQFGGHAVCWRWAPSPLPSPSSTSVIIVIVFSVVLVIKVIVSRGVSWCVVVVVVMVERKL